MVDDVFDFGADFVAFGEEGVEGGFTDDISHAGLGELGGGPVKILDFDDGFGGVFDLEINDGVDGDGDVVFGHGFLVGDIDGFDADVDFFHVLKNGDDDAPTWLQGAGIFSKSEEDASFILVDLFDEEDEENQNGDDSGGGEEGDDGGDVVHFIFLIIGCLNLGRSIMMAITSPQNPPEKRVAKKTWRGVIELSGWISTMVQESKRKVRARPRETRVPRKSPRNQAGGQM